MAFIGIDLGTTNIKAALYDGKNLKQIKCLSGTVKYLRDGRKVEFDVGETADTVFWMLHELGEYDFPVDQIILTGQAESLVLLGKDGSPLRKAISWMDERSAAECKELSQKFTSDAYYGVTGQKAIIPTWPATKILHLFRSEPELMAKTAVFIMLKDFIAYRLSGIFSAEKTIATFSSYFDIFRGCYWQEMLDLIKVTGSQLPPLVEPCTVLGPLKPGLNLGKAYKNTLVNTGMLDHFAGMIGNGVIKPGVISESTGTVMGLSAIAEMPLSQNNSLPLHYGPFPGTFAVLPVVESGGISLEWFRDNFLSGLTFKELDEKVKNRKIEKLLFLPYLVGINAPDFDNDACGVFFGLRSDTDAVDMARSVMEGVALLLNKNVEEMRRCSLNFSYIISTGGAAKSDVWSQIKADICGLDVWIPANNEAACLGAAMIGAVSAGVFPDYQSAVDACVIISKVFHPCGDNSYTAKKKGFKQLYDGMLSTARAMQH